MPVLAVIRDDVPAALDVSKTILTAIRPVTARISTVLRRRLARSMGSDGKFHVAVSQHYLPRLRNYVSLESYTAKPCINVHDGEVGVYGLHEAKERARRRLCNALNGIATHGAGLTRFYWGHVVDARLQVLIDYAILTCEIWVISPVMGIMATTVLILPRNHIPISVVAFGGPACSFPSISSVTRMARPRTRLWTGTTTRG